MRGVVLSFASLVDKKSNKNEHIPVYLLLVFLPLVGRCMSAGYLFPFPCASSLALLPCPHAPAACDLLRAGACSAASSKCSYWLDLGSPSPQASLGLLLWSAPAPSPAFLPSLVPALFPRGSTLPLHCPSCPFLGDTILGAPEHSAHLRRLLAALALFPESAALALCNDKPAAPSSPGTTGVGVGVDLKLMLVGRVVAGSMSSPTAGAGARGSSWAPC